MDIHHVHDFWGFSAPLDLAEVAPPANRAGVAPSGKGADMVPPGGPWAALLLGSGDCRHVLVTLEGLKRLEVPAELWVYEAQPEVLARHMLLLATFLDTNLAPKDVIRLFLEIHGNALLHEQASAYMAKQGQELAELVLSQRSKESSTSPTLLSRLFDFSQLKYREVDELVAVVRSWSSKAPVDMHTLWDRRLRSLYGDRYDARTNLVDWDYSMRLAEVASIVHSRQFAEWRQTGNAYSARQCTEANRSLLSQAEGRTGGAKEGLRVSVRGYWGDVVSSPYIAFGVHSENQELFRKSNKQHMHTAVDVAEYNLKTYQQRLRSNPPAPTPRTEGERVATPASTDNATSARDATSAEGVTSAEGATSADDAKSADDVSADDATSARSATSAVQNRCANVKVVLVSGDLEKAMLKKAKFVNKFDVIVAGARQLHMVSRELKSVATRGAKLCLEGPRFMLELRKEEQLALQEKLLDLAKQAGWNCVTEGAQGLQEHLFFQLAHDK